MRGPLGETYGKGDRPALPAIPDVRAFTAVTSDDDHCRISYSRHIVSEDSPESLREQVRTLRLVLRACGQAAVLHALELLANQGRIEVTTAQRISTLVLGGRLEIHQGGKIEVSL